MAQLAEPWPAPGAAGGPMARTAAAEPGVEPGAEPVAGNQGTGVKPRSPGRRRLLLLASLYEMPYRVLACAAACDAEVFVLGDAGARGLRLSRYCSRYFDSEHIVSGHYDEGLALEINCLVRDLGIDMVLPGDAPSTRALIACRALIETSCFPLPPLDVFDRLNDKWAFVQLCDSLGIRCPQSTLHADVATLADDIARGAIQFPIVAKPLANSGSHGCFVIDRDNVERLSAINYRPIIAQEFIPGEDIGASIFARSGEVTAIIGQRFTGRVYHTFHHEGIFRDVSRLVEHLGLDGVYNFDMRLTDDGAVYYLECNPRFFFKMNMSMAAGMNFVEYAFPDRLAALPKTLPDGTNVVMPNALARAPWRLFCATAREWRMAHHIYADVLPRLIERVGLLP